MTAKPRTIVAILSLCLNQATFAQQGPLVSERPSFSSSPLALDAGSWQIEGGYLYANDDNGVTVTEQTLPQMLLRYGIDGEFELQLLWDGFTRREVGGSSRTGVTDAQLGLKIQLAENDAKIPVAFFAAVSVPTGESGFTSDSFDPKIGVFWQYRGPLEVFGAAELTRSDGDYRLDNGVGLTYAFSGSVSGFVEWEANIPESGGSTHSANLGVAWLQHDSLQFDLHGSLGLNSRASDYSLGAGAAYRF